MTRANGPVIVWLLSKVQMIIQPSSCYHSIIIQLSSHYHPVIIPLSSSYHPVIIQLSFSYYLVSLSYSMVTFCGNSFRLTEACSCTILLSINNSRSGQEHAYTSGCTAHCPWKCKRIFFFHQDQKSFKRTTASQKTVMCIG